MVAIRMIIIAAIVLCVAIPSAAQISSGYATYSNGGGGVCSGGSSGLPSVAMNAAQFANGAACGQCVQISGTGNGAGKNPVSTAPYIAVINNVCPQCSYGDIDLQESGDGKFGITWSFVGCPGAGRKLIEQPFNGDNKVYVVRGHAEATKERVQEPEVQTTEEQTPEETAVPQASPEESATTEKAPEIVARALIAETADIAEEPVTKIEEPVTETEAESPSESQDAVSQEIPAEDKSSEEMQKVSRRLMRA